MNLFRPQSIAVDRCQRPAEGTLGHVLARNVLGCRFQGVDIGYHQSKIPKRARAAFCVADGGGARHCARPGRHRDAGGTSTPCSPLSPSAAPARPLSSAPASAADSGPALKHEIPQLAARPHVMRLVWARIASALIVPEIGLNASFAHLSSRRPAPIALIWRNPCHPHFRARLGGGAQHRLLASRLDGRDAGRRFRRHARLSRRAIAAHQRHPDLCRGNYQRAEIRLRR